MQQTLDQAQSKSVVASLETEGLNISILGMSVATLDPFILQSKKATCLKTQTKTKRKQRTKNRWGASCFQGRHKCLPHPPALYVCKEQIKTLCILAMRKLFSGLERCSDIGDREHSLSTVTFPLPPMWIGFVVGNPDDIAFS